MGFLGLFYFMKENKNVRYTFVIKVLDWISANNQLVRKGNRKFYKIKTLVKRILERQSDKGIFHKFINKRNKKRHSQLIQCYQPTRNIYLSTDLLRN